MGKGLRAKPQTLRAIRSSNEWPLVVSVNAILRSPGWEKKWVSPTNDAPSPCSPAPPRVAHHEHGDVLFPRRAIAHTGRGHGGRGWNGRHGWFCRATGLFGLGRAARRWQQGRRRRQRNRRASSGCRSHRHRGRRGHRWQCGSRRVDGGRRLGRGHGRRLVRHLTPRRRRRRRGRRRHLRLRGRRLLPRSVLSRLLGWIDLPLRRRSGRMRNRRRRVSVVR